MDFRENLNPFFSVAENSHCWIPALQTWWSEKVTVEPGLASTRTELACEVTVDVYIAAISLDTWQLTGQVVGEL